MQDNQNNGTSSFSLRSTTVTFFDDSIIKAENELSKMSNMQTRNTDKSAKKEENKNTNAR